MGLNFIMTKTSGRGEMIVRFDLSK
jgi:hypothetical protein